MFDLGNWGRGKRLIGMNARKRNRDEKAKEILRDKLKDLEEYRYCPCYVCRKKSKPENAMDLRVKYPSPFMSGDAFEAWIKKRGWKYLGSGAFSTVYARKEGDTRVMKVNRRIDPWWEYVQWAYENGHKQFAPNVFSYKYFPGKKIGDKEGNPFYVAIVERLVSSVNYTDNRHYLTDTLWTTMARKGEQRNPVIDAVSDLVAPGLKRFAKDFREKFEEGNYSTDCWGHNKMLAIDGKRWILNDPLCGVPKNDNIIQGRYRSTG